MPCVYFSFILDEIIDEYLKSVKEAHSNIKKPPTFIILGQDRCDKAELANFIILQDAVPVDKTDNQPWRPIHIKYGGRRNSCKLSTSNDSEVNTDENTTWETIPLPDIILQNNVSVRI